MSRQSDSNRRPADYKSAALPAELCRRCPYESRFSEFIKSSSEDRPASRMNLTLLTRKYQGAKSTRACPRENPRYGPRRLLSSSSLRCDFSLTQCVSHDSTGSLPRTDSEWLVRVGLDNARISSRISASRSGGSGDMLIYVRDAADLKLCLLLPSFFADGGGNPSSVLNGGSFPSLRASDACVFPGRQPNHRAPPA